MEEEELGVKFEVEELPTTKLDVECKPEVEELPTTKLGVEELPTTKLEVDGELAQIVDVVECVEKEPTAVEKLAMCVAKDQLIPGSISLRDTSLKGPGICMFTYYPDRGHENFGYFFIKKGSELWNDHQRSHPRIGELFTSRRNPHDLICIGVTIDAKKPLAEEIVFSYYSFHTHELLLML